MREIVIRVKPSERDDRTVALVRTLFPEFKVTLIECVDRSPFPDRNRRKGSVIGSHLPEME